MKVKIVPLPILRETAKAVAVPKLYPFRKKGVKISLNEGESTKVSTKYGDIYLICPYEWGKEYVLTNRVPRTEWLPKSQITIENDMVTEVEEWLIPEKFLIIDYDTFKRLTTEAVRQLVIETKGDRFLFYEKLTGKLAELLGTRHARSIMKLHVDMVRNTEGYDYFDKLFNRMIGGD